MEMKLRGKSWFFTGLMAIVLFLFLLPAWGYCAIPQKVNYQGYLTDTHGVPINGAMQMTFRIYSVDTSGTPLWTETQSVTVTNGVYNVTLGNITALSLAFDIPYYLGITVGTDPEMSPRKVLTSVGYAFRAMAVDTVGSHTHSAADITSGTLATNRYSAYANLIVESYLNSGIEGGIPTIGYADARYVNEGQANSITTPMVTEGHVTKSKLSASGGTNGQVLGTDGTNLVWQNSSGFALPYLGGVSTNQAAFWVSNWGTQGTGIWGLATNGIGVYGEGNGSPGWGVWGKHTGTGNYGHMGTGVAGVEAYGYGNSRGVQGQSQNATGVHGQSGDGYGTYGESASGTGVKGISAGTGNYGELGHSLAGLHAIGTGSNFGAFVESSGGTSVYGTSSSGTAAFFRSDTGHGLVVESGNVGIGTTNPSRKVHVAGSGPRILVETYDGFNPEVNFRSSETSDWAIYKHTATGDLRFYQDGDQFILKNITGRVQVKVLEILGGADLSEQFDVKGIGENTQPSPGMVVSIDRKQPGKLLISNKAYDKTVAGVISGAGGVNPGMLMGQEGSAANGTSPVALTGRVYCWADASPGPIEPGDLLTTSATPGHAMKVTDYMKAQGAVIGKAMSGLAEGRGLVLVLVSLQ
jgi:hypothetical protein